MTEREKLMANIIEQMIEKCENLFTWINIPRAPNRSFERVTLSDELLKEVYHQKKGDLNNVNQRQYT